MNLKLKNELNHLMNEYHSNKQEVQQVNRFPTRNDRFSLDFLDEQSMYDNDRKCSTSVLQRPKGNGGENRTVSRTIEKI